MANITAKTSSNIINCLIRHLRNTMQNINARTGRLKVIMIRFPEANRKNYFMRLSFR